MSISLKSRLAAKITAKLIEACKCTPSIFLSRGRQKIHLSDKKILSSFYGALLELTVAFISLSDACETINGCG